MTHSALAIAILAGLGGMLGWGLADFFAKKTIDAIGDVTSLVVAHICGTILLALFAAYQLLSGHALQLPQGGMEWGGLAFFGVLQGIVYLLVYRGFGKGQVAVLNPIFASFSGLTAVLSVLFFGELLTGHLIFALIVVFIGIVLMNIDPAALRMQKLAVLRVPGFTEIAIATVLAAFWTVLWNQFIGGKDWVAYALMMYLFMTVALLIYAWFTKTSLKVSDRSVWVYLLLIGATEVFAYLAISLGYSATSLTSVVALLSGAFSLPTIILARLFLKERVTKLQTIGSLVIIGGIALVSLL